jgi:Cys-rich protein (TIGR01571 family)
MAGEAGAVMYETAAKALGEDVATKLRARNARVARTTLVFMAAFLPLYIVSVFLGPYGGAVNNKAMIVSSLVVGVALVVASCAFLVALTRAFHASGLGCCFRLRTALRAKYGIPGNRLDDCCVETWCAPCALAQEARTVARWEGV